MAKPCKIIGSCVKYCAVEEAKTVNVNIIHGPNRRGYIPYSLASAEKAKSLLDYQPSHAIDIGIEEFVEWDWGNLE